MDNRYGIDSCIATGKVEQAPTYILELTYHAGQIVRFLLAQHNFWLARNKL